MSDGNLVTWTVYSNYASRSYTWPLGVNVFKGKFNSIEAGMYQNFSKKKLKDKFLKH